MSQVVCPRCQLKLSAKLHAITSTDAQECPRCWGLDRLEVPMALPPDGKAFSREPAPILIHRTQQLGGG